MIELERCPLCKGKVIINVEQLAVYPGTPYCTIFCPSCGLKLTRRGNNGYQEAIDAWNTRHERTCRNINDKYSRSWVCSECNESHVVNAADSEPFRYCPSCGCKVVD